MLRWRARRFRRVAVASWARDTAAKVFERGLQQRVVIIEFESVESALRTYQSSAYQTALKRLKGAAERDVRIMEGI